MKVFICNPDEPNSDQFLAVRAIHFHEHNREATRDHVKRETNATFIWFEDEEPPNEVIEVLERAQAQQQAEGAPAAPAESAPLPVLFQRIFECRMCHSVTPSEVPRTVLDNWNTDLILMAQAPSGVGVRVSGVHWLDESGSLRHPGGTYLNGYLQRVGYSIDPLSQLPRPYTTNVVQCWPGAKRNSKGKFRDRKPNAVEIRNCQKWWLAEVDLLRPTAVLLLGQLAADSFSVACRLSTDFATMLDSQQGHVITIGNVTCSYFTVPHPVAPYSGSLGGRNDYYDFAFDKLRQTLRSG